MNGTELAAVIAAVAAAISAGATIWYGLLTLRLVRATRASQDAMIRQSDEVLRGRLDARAPRVAVRSVQLDETPSISIGSSGRGTRRITEPVFKMTSLSDARSLTLTTSITLANEGDQTARVALPENARHDLQSNSAILLAPGEVAVIELRSSASLGQWSQAASERAPIVRRSRLVIDDSFADGVIDVIELCIAAYAVSPPNDQNEVFTEPEARAALGLLSAVEVEPTRREYKGSAEKTGRVQP